MAETSTPAFAVYTVIEREKQEPFWLRIGAAWAHKDGSGYNVTLDALPHNGRIVLRLPKVEEEEPVKPAKKR
jgi:hypothetical protein